MAISTQDIVLARRRFYNAVSVDTPTRLMATAFFSWLAQQGGRPDLQVKEFDHLTGTDTVIADAACSLYAIVLQKTTVTAAYFKGSDSASASSSTAPEVSLRQNSIKTDLMLFPRTLPMANGFTISSDTTASGNTTSAAGDGASGVVLLGA